MKRIDEIKIGRINCFCYGGYDVVKQRFTAPEGDHKKARWFLYQYGKYVGKYFDSDTDAMKWIDENE